MSEIKVNSIKGVGASTAAITVNNSDGTCTANITNNLSNRNLIINGAMQVAQRGTSTASSATSGHFQVDRFQVRADNTDNASFTHAQVTDAPSGTGFSKSFKLSVDTIESTLDANENIYLVQKIEGQNVQQLAYGSSSAQKVTLSFYVKSYQTGNFTVTLYKDDTTSSIITSTYTVNQSATWEKKTITFVGLTTSGIANDNGNGLAVYWQLAAGTNYTSADSTSWGNYSDAGFAYGQAVNFVSSTNNYWQITGVQLEVGSVATDFEHRSFAQELELCKRYYQQINGDSNDYTGFPAYTESATSMRVPVQLHPAMRAAFTVSKSGLFRFQGATNDSDNSAVSFSLEGVNTSFNACTIRNTSYSGMGAADRPGNLQFMQDGSKLKFDAEL